MREQTQKTSLSVLQERMLKHYDILLSCLSEVRILYKDLLTDDTEIVSKDIEKAQQKNKIDGLTQDLDTCSDMVREINQLCESMREIIG